jgi:hemolysin activation/secretion protein
LQTIYARFGLCIGIFLAQTVQAAPSEAASALQQLQRQQQKQQIRQEQQYQNDLKSSQPPVNFNVPVPEAKPSTDGGACLEVKTIKLQGVTLFSERELAPVLRLYEQRCLNASEIEALMTEVTARYILKGYVSARVYLAQQDLSGGTMILLVLEGTLEGVRVDDGGSDSIALFNTFPGEVGEPLNLRDIEQAVDQINRLQSNNVVTHINPGSEAGGSVLVFENHPTKRWQASLSHDNYGAEGTGKEEAGVNASIDNLLGVNDFLSLGYLQSLPYHLGSEGSRLDSLTYVVPFGYSKMALNASKSKFYTPLNLPSGLTLQSAGETENVSLMLDRTLYRDRDSLWNVSMTVNRRDSKNYLDGELISVSSRKLTVVNLDSSFMFPLLGGVANINGGYAQGTTWFDALEDPSNLPGWAPLAQFKKWKYGANYQRPFQVAEQPFQFSSTLVGQHSEDVLYGSEQILIGGIYSVRGFSENSLSGDDGYYWRNDLSMPLYFDFGATLRPYIGLDYGRVSSILDDVPRGSLTGAAVGASLSVNALYLDIFASHALDKPSGFSDEGSLVYFRASLNF